METSNWLLMKAVSGQTGIITPHAQRERGKVIGLGVLVYQRVR